jgi:hypothetical protein
MNKIEIFEEDGDNTLSLDNEHADFTIDVYPESKTYQSRMSLKDDCYYRTTQYQYRIKIDPIKVETRLTERVDEPPERYCVKDGVVLESDILADRKEMAMSSMTKEFIADLKKEVEWHEEWVGDPVSMYLLSKHPDIISPEDYRRYLRQLSEKIKSAIQKAEKTLESDKTGLQIIDGEYGRAVWYPKEKLEKLDDKELEKLREHASKFQEKLFDEKAPEYIGISEGEFRSGKEMLEHIETFLNKKPTLLIKKEGKVVQPSKGSMSFYNYFAIGLTLLFIGLKLTDSIDWSWWLVLSPYLILEGLGFLVGFLNSLNK